jgi:hypothetical protein
VKRVNRTQVETKLQLRAEPLRPLTALTDKQLDQVVGGEAIRKISTADVGGS